MVVKALDLLSFPEGPVTLANYLRPFDDLSHPFQEGGIAILPILQL